MSCTHANVRQFGQRHCRHPVVPNNIAQLVRERHRSRASTATVAQLCLFRGMCRPRSLERLR